MEKLLTIQQVCEILQVSQSLVYKWVHYRYIPHIKIGTMLRFRESDIDRWVKVKMKRGRTVLREPVELPV